MIARQVIEVLAAVRLGRAELPHHFLTFRIVRRALVAGKIAEMQHDVPLKRRSALVAAVFGLPDCLGQALPAELLSVPTCAHPVAQRLNVSAGI